MGSMAETDKKKTFDAHLGSLITNLARGKGGRELLAGLLGVTTKTISRRSVGNGEYTVRELNIVARAVGMTTEELLNVALRNYSGSTAEEGVRMLMAEAEELRDFKAVSEAPISLDDHRSAQTPAEMSDTEREGLPHAAFTNDPEIGHDEQE